MPVSRRDIEALLVPPAEPCLSVFVTLEHRGVAGEEDRQRAALLLRDAEGALGSWGLRSTQVDAIVRPAWHLLEEGPWPSTWGGLVFYSASGVSRQFGLHAPVKDRVVLADRFLLAPLIRELVSADRFWLLALSRNQPRLLHGDESHLQETGADLPSFAQIVAVDDAEASLQYHRGSGGPVRAAVMFHGHGGTKDAEGEQVRRWVNAVAAKVEQTLRDSDAPLVLAGVAEQLALYRRASRYGHIAAGELPGSPDRRSLVGLHAEAWPLVEQRHAETLARDVGRYRRRAGTGWTVTGHDDVLQAAEEGRVDVLFATADPQPDDEVAVDAAVAAAWARGGTVHLLDCPTPGDGDVAAILRYAAAPAARSTHDG